MNFNPHYNPFSSIRNTAYFANGVVATSHPVAADLGNDILKKGGSAVDAALTTAIALAVLEPTSNGLGSDCFALVHDGNKLHGLNASGWSPKGLSPEVLEAQGKSEISPFGWDAVTVPGAMAGWEQLHQRFGRLSRAEILDPIIDRFTHGVAVPPTIAHNWNRAYQAFDRRFRTIEGDRDSLFHNWFSTFAPKETTPQAGQLWSNEDQIKCLKLLKDEGFRSLYDGTLAQVLLDFSNSTGGYLASEDLSLFQPQWVDPISVRYKGIDVWEIPPNGQGITALMALGMTVQDQLHHHGNVSDVHLSIEAMKLAFSDTMAYVTDPKSMGHSSHNLLDPSYLHMRRQLITDWAQTPEPGTPPQGGTVYLAAADSDGMMVSFIQSNYMGFGSGLVVPGYGISLQNRGHNFTLEMGHPNRLAGRKRPYHTIIPGFLTEQGRALGPFGVMGGFMQPQGHMQVVQNLVDYNMNPQQALDAPRWQWLEGKKVIFEPEYNPAVVAQLSDSGHQAAVDHNYSRFGRGQIILKTGQDSYAAATEKRCDGYVAGW